MQSFKSLTSKTCALPKANIDTDQIIPARFLKVTDKAGLGENLFADWRFDGQGELRPEFPLNQEVHRGAQILIAGDNFGCGSSREHAPWALLGFGIRVVISTSFGDIFRNNACRNGLLPVVVDDALHTHLLATAPAEITVDLETQKVTAGDQECSFSIEAFARYCILEGTDPFDYLLSQEAHITRYEEACA